MVLFVLFVPFTLGLLMYHSYLICAGMTTWEHTRRSVITYLKIYPVGLFPFYEGIVNNVKNTFLHGGKCKDWELKQAHRIREI